MLARFRMLFLLRFSFHVTPAKRAIHLCVLLAFVQALACPALVAQVADTTAADTTFAPTDTLSILVPPGIADSLSAAQAPDSSAVPPPPLPPIAFYDTVAGSAVGDTLPTRHISLDPQGMLAETPGSFLYDFGASGWPDGWSPFGLPPNDIALTFNDIPFNNPITGLPQYELIPISLLQPLHLEQGRPGSPISVTSRLRSFSDVRPLTEIHYRSTNNGLQSAWVSHNQKRRLRLLGKQGVLGLLLAYGGHGANGEYDGSKLEKARQLYARIRYQNSLGSFELMNLSNRRRLGAHAGVEPGTGLTDYIFIYSRFTAQVENPNAQRRIVRNDLSATLRSAVFGNADHPFTATGYWTTNKFRYLNPNIGLQDTLLANTGTLGYSLSQAFPLQDALLSLHAEGSVERLRETSRDSAVAVRGLPDTLGVNRHALYVYARGRWQRSGLSVDIKPGYYKQPHGSLIGGTASVSFNYGIFRAFANASHTLASIPLIAEYGWGNTIVPPDRLVAPTRTLIRGGVAVKGTILDLTITAFAHRTEDAFDYFDSSTTDSVFVNYLASPAETQGLSLDAGFRRLASRGIYATVAPTLFNRPSGGNASLAQSLPEMYVDGRIGMRYRIFRGDLDFDLYARGRYWSTFLSRTLHPETGLLVLREVNARPVDASLAFDVFLEAGIRTAKIFVGFENLLSGTQLITGNLLVPDYPLPQRRFRLGVFWPIWN